MTRKKLERQQKTQAINQQNALCKEIIEQTKIYTNVLENLFTEHTNLCNGVYNKPTTVEESTKFAQDLYQKTLELQLALENYGDKYLKDTFVNEFYCLKIKASILLGKTRMSSALSTANYHQALSCFVHAYTLLYMHLDKLDYYKDITFQELMNYCINAIEFYKVPITLPNNGNHADLIYDFSKKCSDKVIKFQWQLAVSSNFIQDKDTPLKEKNEFYRKCLQLYEDLASHFEGLMRTNQLTATNRIKYYYTTYKVLSFAEKYHPELKNIGLKPEFTKSNKDTLKKFIRLYNTFKETYLKKILDLLSGLDLTQLGTLENYEIRTRGEDLLQHFKKYIKHFLSWHELLDDNEDKTTLDASKKSIIALYHYFKQMVVFYNNYFEKYPESNYRALTSKVVLFDPENDYQQKINTLEDINQTLAEFEKSEVIKERLLLEKRQAQLAICEEAAQFLIDLQNKENKFLDQRRLAKAQRQASLKEAFIPPKEVQEETQTKTRPDKPIKVQESPYFERASLSIENHDYYHAIILYELAYDKAITTQDLYLQLRALDGLTFSYGTLSLSDMAKLQALLKSRQTSSTPLTRERRIALETSIYTIIYKLNVIHNSSLELIAVSQNKGLSLDEESRAGLKHAQEQINDWIDYLSKKALELQNEYAKVIKKMEADKEAFILKLGQEVAPHLTLKKHQAEIKRLGLIKFAQLGNNPPDEDKGPSDRASEKILFTELAGYLSNLCLSTAKPKDSLILPKHLCQKSKLTKSSVPIKPPPPIQELFKLLETFSKEHYLFGSAVLDCILKSHKHQSILPEDLDVIYRGNEDKIIAKGFNPCRYIKNLYYYQVEQWRIELSNIKEDIFAFMLNRVFTISTLYCEKQGDNFVVHDLTGQGLTHLEQMRLVTLKDPNTVFSEDPTTLLLCFKYILKGFHPDLNIINALKNLKPLDDFNRAHVNAITQKQLKRLNLEERKHYVGLFAQYGLLKKLFEIEYDCDVNKALKELENKLEEASTINQNRFFVTNFNTEPQKEMSLLTHLI